MALARYLPSTQFAAMAGSLLLSGGLILGAQYVISKDQATSSLATTTTASASQDTDWQSALEAVAQSSGIAAPATVSPDEVSQLVSEASDSNLTDSVGKALFINLSAATAQGLGDDDPTQQQIISQAAAQATASTTPTYNTSSLTVVADSKDSLHAYGNAVIAAVASHPQANTGDVYAAVGYATDYQDDSRLAPLKTACPDYMALAQDLIAISVPQTLASLDLEAINDIAAMGNSCAQLNAVVDDPLRGLTGLQAFESSNDEATRVFTSIAQNLNSDGILFSKDEPGAAWSALLSASAQ